MYIFGRDKYYRPTIVLDFARIIDLGSTDPSVVSTEAMQASFIFLWKYMKKCMFLEGHTDQWNTITNMAQASMWALPRA